LTFEVTILGSSSARFTADRFQTSQILNHNERYFLIDCGEATQIQLSKYRFSFQKIDKIFISHLHGDHYFGLIGLITTMHLLGRTKELSIYGPKGLKEILEIQLNYSETTLNYPLIFSETNPDKAETIYEDDKLSIISFPLKHRIPCTGFRFTENPKVRNIIKENIPFNLPPLQILELKKGNNISWEGETLIADFCTSKPKKSFSYSFCSDTIFDENLIENISSSDWLYHEATFLHNMLERAQKTYHTTALQAAQLAKNADVRGLLIGHYSSRYHHLEDHLAEAKSVFSNTLIATEGLKVDISS
jgi:ribonuclease Z